MPVQVCDVSNIAIMQWNGLVLAAQTWNISRTSSFTYQLAAQASPTTCSYLSTQWTDWVVTATSVNNPSSVSKFQTISSDGLFSAGPLDDNLAAGVYTITVTSVRLNDFAYSSPLFTNASFPNSFQLTVIDPCLSTKITGPDSIQNFATFAGFN